MNQKFAVGDRVEWTSSSGGSTVTKRGVVIEVIQPGREPGFLRWHCGRGRSEESYAIGEVEAERWSTSRQERVFVKQSQPYWPAANKLRLVSKKEK